MRQIAPGGADEGRAARARNLDQNLDRNRGRA